LYRGLARTLDQHWVAVWTSLLVFVIANSFTLLSFQANGERNSTTLLGSILHMLHLGQPLVAGLTFACAVLFPLFEILAQLYLLSALRWRREAPGFRFLLRFLQWSRPWAMSEVFIVAVLVSVSKLSSVAEVIVGPSLWAFGVLTVLLTWIDSLPAERLWQAAEQAGVLGPVPASPYRSAAAVDGAADSWLSCRYCSLLCRNQPHGRNAALVCPRCHGTLNARKPWSLAMTWAYLVAAILLYIPANVWPVMRTSTLVSEQDDTIVSGVIFLWNTGSWLIAVVVFVASVIVPILKILALIFLCLDASMRSHWQRHQCTTLYRLVELIGRWSMLDIFVVTLMAALVHFHTYVNIVAGPGAAAFGAVVVLTVLAAGSFDPRLLWD
jgi:paraquat-inducible protein A